MKKIKIGLILAVTLVFLTACSCSKKQYTVIFDSNGGTRVQSQTVEKGGKVTKPKDPTREDYTFDSWQLDGKVYDFDSEVTEDITLVAKWTKVIKEEKATEVSAAVNSCTLTCSSGYALNNDTCSCEKVSVTEVTVENSEVELNIDSSTTISVNVKPSGAFNKNVTYTSSDESVAIVDQNGKVTAIKPGSAVITITSEDGGKVTTVVVTVLDVYEYYVTKLDNSGISYKVVIYKNGTLVSKEELSNIGAVYNDNLKYLGRYDSATKAIMVDKTQVDSISKIKVNGKTYTIKKVELI